MVKMDYFEFNTDLLISLMEARPVLWDKMDDIYKDRNKMKRAWEEVCICLQENFEALGDVKKTASLLFIFLISARKQLWHLLENNKVLYSLHCSLLTPHVLIVHRVHLQDQSLSKRLQTYNHLSHEQNCAEQHGP